MQVDLVYFKRFRCKVIEFIMYWGYCHLYLQKISKT